MSEEPEQSVSPPAPTVAFVHFDLHPEHFNGITTQAEKLEKAFGALGWQLRTVAGLGAVSHLIPGLQRQDLVPDALVQYDEILAAIRGVDLVWVINVCTSPYNRRAADLLVDAVTELQLPTIFNHHDLREDDDFEYYLPVDQERPWHTVVTSKSPLEGVVQKSPTQHVLGPGFDPSQEALDRSSILETLALGPGHRLFAQPTRFDPEKNVIGALQCALDLHLQDTARPVTFWITGTPGIYAKGHYLSDFLNLAQRCESLGMTVRWGNCGLQCDPAHAAYTAADLIFFPPHRSGGFGLPPIEAALHLRPVAVGRDPHVETVRAKAGLNYLPLDATAIRQWFSLPERVRDGQLRLNCLRATSRFSFGKFVQTVRELLQDCHLDHLVEAGEAYLATTAATGACGDQYRALRSPSALGQLSPSCLRTDANFQQDRSDNNIPGAISRRQLNAQTTQLGLPLLSPISPIQSLG